MRFLSVAASSTVPEKAPLVRLGPTNLNPRKHVRESWGAEKPQVQTRQALASGYEFSTMQEAAGIRVYEQSKQPGRRIVAEAVVQAPAELVWRVLTDYEALPTFVPNLDYCERLPSRSAGKQLIRQVACSQGGLWRLEAEAMLEVEEVQGPLGRREARFNAIEGDFKLLAGRWVVEPDPNSPAGHATVLRYDISVQPRIPLPSSVVSYVVRAGLPANVKAIVQRAEYLANKRLQASGLASWAGVEEDPPLPPRWEESEAWPSGYTEELKPLPSKGPFWARGSPYAEAAPLTAEKQRQQLAREAARSAYLGTASVPLPPSASRAADLSVKRSLDEQLQNKQQLQSLYPAFGLRRSNSASSSSSIATEDSSSSMAESAAVDTAAAACPIYLPAEVHLRRLDGLDYLHRRAVAAVTVDAPASAVWQVLTDYDHLAEFIPNLAASERIKLPPSAPPNVVRIRQVGYKRMLYMCLHAESVLDLIEKPCSEIQFRQVAGDFERFQGKWMLSEGPADPELAAPGYNGPQTQLKYAMEIIIPRTGRMLGVIEPVLERVVFEDAPANLAAIKRRVEQLQLERRATALEEAGDATKAATLRRRSARPRLSDMTDDFSVLAAELERCFGDKKLLPTRETMRDMNRTDIEKAITAHGGPSAVAKRLGWKLQAKPRKPRGYWDSLANVKQEVDEFIQDNELQPRMMPLKNDFIRAGRFDLARAVERWGGLYELAEQLGYSVASPVFASTEWTEHVSELAAETGLSGKQGLFELAAKTYRKGKGAERNSSSTAAAAAKGEYAKMPTVREEIDAW